MSKSELDNGDGPGGDGSGSPEWDGYSDYKYVSYQISSAIDDAIDSYATLQGLHDEGAKIKANQAAQARQPILAAAMRLLPELKNNQSGNETYEEMVQKWTEDGVPNRDVGYIPGLRQVDLTQSCPDWIYEFVLDLRKAGWELGYLQAGRYEEDDDEDDAHASAREMLKDIFESK